MIKTQHILKNIKISNNLKKEIVRYTISFFFAWLVSALVSDFPFFREIIKSLKLDVGLTNFLVFSTEGILNFIGFITYSDGSFLKIEGTNGIRFTYGCLGFRELSFFIVFILFQFGKVIHKLWYVLLGISLLLFLNVIRAVLIAWGQFINPDDVQLIHDIISPVIMYPAIFFLWIFWIVTYGKNK